MFAWALFTRKFVAKSNVQFYLDKVFQQFQNKTTVANVKLTVTHWPNLCEEALLLALWQRGGWYNMVYCWGYGTLTVQWCWNPNTATDNLVMFGMIQIKYWSMQDACILTVSGDTRQGFGKLFTDLLAAGKFGRATCTSAGYAWLAMLHQATHSQCCWTKVTYLLWWSWVGF